MDETTTPTEEVVNQLVTENVGWAESIARSVARAWNMDWQMDGLDGAAMEALFFCARRFDPSRGVPFRGYARKRIHEASCDAARRCRNFNRPGASRVENEARQISAELLNVFPELRSGELPGGFEEGGDDDMRGSIRQLLMGANLIAATNALEDRSFEETLDAKRIIEIMAALEITHQFLLWKVYWEGVSMRGVAEEWDTDELNVIREHKALLTFLFKSSLKGKAGVPPKVRPGLKVITLKLKKQGTSPPFTAVLQGKMPL